MSQLVIQDPPVETASPQILRPGKLFSVFRTVFSFPVMLMAWIVLIVVRLAERSLPDPDIWWHLRNAQYLFVHHALPNFDTYSFTVAGHPWINYEWLAEIPYYLAWRAFGLEGIEILMLVVLEVIFLGVLYLCYRRTGHIKASILACWVAAALGTVNFGPRTILFGYIYLVILLAILERFRSEGRAPLWLLPPLFCLWANTHGSWVLGMTVLVIFIVCGFVEGQWGLIRTSRWAPKQLLHLLAAFAASCAALFFNPYGYRLVLYPLDVVLRQRWNVAFISEWASVNFHGPRGIVVLVLLAALFLSALAMRHRWMLSDLVLLLVALYGGLCHERLLFFAGIIAAPVVAELLEAVPRYRPEIDKPFLNAVIICGILAFVVWRFPWPAQLQKQVAEEYPAEILPFLEAHKLSGRTLNYYEWGGYLGWKDPELKVFIDSRMDIFEYAGVFEDYVKLMVFRDSPKILDEYRIRYVLFPPDAPLAMLLRQNPEWKVDFSGPVSTLLERAGPMPAGPAKNSTTDKHLEPW
jgi:hypothetical protein